MPQKRAAAVGGALLIVLLLSVAALALLIFGRGERLTADAVLQRSRSFPYHQYARGDILDRQGRPLVNVEEPCLVVLPAMTRGREAELASALGRLLELDRQQLAARLRSAADSSLQPVVLKTGLTAAEKAALEEAALPGVMVLTLAARYDRQHTASQLIGSVQARGENGGYRGISGLELQYDDLLSGREDLQIRLQVDAKGRMNGRPEQVAPAAVRASSLSLTLDKDHQQIAEQALAEMGLHGSCVVMDPMNGDILALASYPGYDPYGWESAPDGAFIQRALRLYPPASTFKTVLAAAALAENARPSAIAKTTAADVTDGAFVCTGSYVLPDGRTVSCAGHEAHGEVDLARALSVSCNCYFVALGEELGGETVLDYSRRLGLDRLSVTGLDCGDETADFFDFDGDIPGELANACLGEDGVRISPVQEAALFSVFANGGFLVQPRLVATSDDGAGAKTTYPVVPPRRVLSARDAETIRLMLDLVVEEGTGRAARDEYVSAGGKTGSSETGTVWFSGFFPAEDPRLVVVVCLEQGASGGAEAAAVFRQVADAITLLDGRV